MHESIEPPMSPGRIPAETALAEECQAFLDGTYAELAYASDAPVPVWAWMNLLAHGTEAELRDAARALGEGDSWHQARAFLAGEVLEAIGPPHLTLVQLQHDVLVPLELDLLDCQCSNRWTPAQLVRGQTGVLPNRGTPTGR